MRMAFSLLMVMVGVSATNLKAAPAVLCSELICKANSEVFEKLLSLAYRVCKHVHQLWQARGVISTEYKIVAKGIHNEDDSAIIGWC